MRDKNNGNPWALLPIGVFLAIFLGAGILSGDFYTMPAIVGFLIAPGGGVLPEPESDLSEEAGYHI